MEFSFYITILKLVSTNVAQSKLQHEFILLCKVDECKCNVKSFLQLMWNSHFNVTTKRTKIGNYFFGEKTVIQWSSHVCPLKEVVKLKKRNWELVRRLACFFIWRPIKAAFVWKQNCLLKLFHNHHNVALHLTTSGILERIVQLLF